MPAPARPPDPEDLLVAGAAALGVAIDEPTVARFRLYREELLRWSGQINLTALRRPAAIVREGFLDALACAPLIPAGARRVVDIGSGAGFPAIPLALVRPDLAFTLIEATRKKVTFLRHVGRTLGLPIVVVGDRAETVARDPAHAGRYDVGLARAVAPLPQQAALVRPFLRAGGTFLAQVGALPAALDDAVKDLGFWTERAVPVPAVVEPGRHIVLLRADEA